MKRIKRKHVLQMIVIPYISVVTLLAAIGLLEWAVIMLYLFAFAYLIYDDMQGRDPKIPKPAFSIEDFFAAGGYAVCWNEGECKKKCSTLTAMLDYNASNVEFWLDGDRFVFDNQYKKKTEKDYSVDEDYLQKIAEENLL